MLFLILLLIIFIIANGSMVNLETRPMRFVNGALLVLLLLYVLSLMPWPYWWIEK